MSGTPRLTLPLLSVGQAQKELFHNEALLLLDSAVAAAVLEPPRATPPSSPVVGACYLVAAAPTGAWAGRQQYVAAYGEAGWRFIAPIEGMVAYVVSDSVSPTYRAGAWELGSIRGSSLIIGGQQVVGTRRAAIASPAGGATVDSQARSAIDQILSAIRQHGLIEM